MTDRVERVAREVHALLLDLPYATYFRDIELSMPDDIDRDEILEAVEALLDIGVIIDRKGTGELELSPCGRDWDGRFMVFAPGVPVWKLEEESCKK